MSVTEALGAARVVRTSAGPIHLRDTGSGAGSGAGSHTSSDTSTGAGATTATIVCLPGFLANGDLWAPIVPGLIERGFRVISLDAVTGGHGEPMHDDADLGPHGLAAILGEVIEGLDVDDVTLVANDSGCAVTQVLITGEHPGAKRVGRVVFATGDFFEHFPPAAFKPLLALPKVPFGITAMVKALRANAVWQAPTSFGWLTHDPLPQHIRDSFLAGALEHDGVRRDLSKILAGFDSRITMEAAQRFPAFDRPVLFVWAGADKFFPPSDADKAAELFPDATVVKLEGARTFVMWDQPGEVVDAIAAFHRR